MREDDREEVFYTMVYLDTFESDGYSIMIVDAKNNVKNVII